WLEVVESAHDQLCEPSGLVAAIVPTAGPPGQRRTVAPAESTIVKRSGRTGAAALATATHGSAREAEASGPSGAIRPLAGWPVKPTRASSPASGSVMSVSRRTFLTSAAAMKVFSRLGAKPIYELFAKPRRSRS
ncbi:MAG: hypothetical protein QOE17_1298, partial [Gaiellales bacterium]|nr:hypothetical protein [Gaiellales bacterium]